MKQKKLLVALPNQQRNIRNKPKFHEQGISLMIVLFILVLLVILSVGASQMNILQERGAGNLRDQTLAFQAAESALRDAELYVDSSIDPTSGFTSGCSSGLCLPSTTSTPVWKDTTLDIWNHSNLTRAYSQTVPNVIKQPAYIVELIAEGVPDIAGGAKDVGGEPPSKQSVYRITAKAWGGTTSAEVTLQSTYLK